MYMGKYIIGAKFSLGGILGPGPGAFPDMMNAAREVVPADTSPPFTNSVLSNLVCGAKNWYLIVIPICVSTGLYTYWFIRALYILRKLNPLSFVLQIRSYSH